MSNKPETGAKQRGRPAGRPEDRRRNLGLQLSPAEREALQAAADRAGIPLSVFIRQAALAAAGHKPQASRPAKRSKVSAILDAAGI